MPQQILLVEPDAARAQQLAAALEAGGFAVVSVGGFSQAVEHLKTARAAVLVTALRLGPYNGLHLIMRARAQYPRLPAVVTAAELDPVLRADAAAFGAEYVVAPESEPAGLLQTVSRIAGTEPV